MVNLQTINLLDLAKSLAQVKGLTASSQDGNVIGIDSVSGSDYFNSMPSVGTIYKGLNNSTRIIVDAIAYPTHVSDSGKRYPSENRFVTVAFNTDTLDIIPGTRTNIGYNELTKRQIIAFDPFAYVLDHDAKAKLARAKAEQAKRDAIEAKRKAEAKALADKKAKDKTNALRTLATM